MLHRSALLLTIMMAFALILGGCSKKDDSPTEPQVAAPTVPMLVFKGPNSTSTDANAQTVKSYVASVNSFSTMFLPYQYIQSVQNGNSWTWTYTQGTFTAKMTATGQTDGSYSWKLLLNGKDPSDGVTYNNWTGMEGSTSADGKTGSWKVYEDNSTVVAMEYSWTTTGNVLTGTQKVYSHGVFTDQIVLVNNPDNSGEMRVYSGSVMTYKAVWNSSGAGQWWSYGTNGAQTGSGSWS